MGTKQAFVTRQLFALAATLALLIGSAKAGAVTPTTIALDGKAAMSIFVSTKSSERVQSVAKTLADYLHRISGGHFEVKEGDGQTGIVVGTAEDFPYLPFDTGFGTGPFDREDYVLHSSVDGLWLIGSTELAVEHAVWDTLYRLGHRQFFPGEVWEVVPHEPNLVLAVDVHERPDYFARRIWYNWGLWGYNKKPYRQWSSRNRAIRGFQLKSGHAYGAIKRRNRKAFRAHPEYRSLVGGERKGNKFCISNPGLRELVVEDAIRRVRKRPDVDSISLEPSDGGGWCECAVCKAAGTPSDLALTLANEAAAAINKLGLGEKYVGIYAYNEHGAPPRIRVHPNVIVSATTSFIRGGLTLDKIMEGWQAQGATLGIYDYFSVIAWDWNLPGRAKAAYPAALAAKIRDYYRRGARFLSAESGDAWGPYGLGYYIASRVMWDIDQADHVEELVDDFLTKAFGPAKEPMVAFYHLITVDRQKRSSADLVGRMYRDLGAALGLARSRPDVQRRIEDLILYTRYVELYNTFANAVGKSKGAAKDAVATHVYRIRKTMMVHSRGFWSRKVGKKATKAQDHPLKNEEPFSRAELDSILSKGIANNQPVERSFDAVSYSDELIPAANRLNLPPVKAGSFPPTAQSRQNYLLWVDQAPANIHLKVRTKKVWNLRPHRISLFSPKEVTVEPVAESGIVKPDNIEYDVILETPYDGLHKLEVRDGGDYTHVEFPEGMPVSVPTGLDTGGVGNQFRGQWTMYFYVPKGTKQVGGWAKRVASWSPRISGTLRNADGDVVYDFAKAEDGWFVVPVGEGQDGRLWKFDSNQGIRQLATVPPYLARTPEELLLPREVVEADEETHRLN